VWKARREERAAAHEKRRWRAGKSSEKAHGMGREDGEREK
jgi:hypothetical protein